MSRSTSLTGTVEAAVLQAVYAKYKPVGDAGMAFDRFLPALNEASALAGARLEDALGRLLARGSTSPRGPHGMSGSFTAPSSLA